MNLRSTLLAATILALPVVANAQNAPIAGLYVGAGAGVNFMQNEKVTVNGGGHSGSGELKTNPGFAGVVSLGWGFGNGLRAEIEGDYRYNSFSGTSGTTVALSGRGQEQKYGGMANVLYDFTMVPYVIPYLGVGVGYQAVQWNNVGSAGPVPGGALSIRTGNTTKGSFAYQGIAGAALPITPALALTAEYRFLGLAGDRNYGGSATFTPTVGTPTTFGGTAKASDNYNHTLLVGLRYAFGAVPAAVPVSAAAPAPAPARSYLVFFDWDKANLTDRARQIIADAAANSKKVSYTKIETNGYTDSSGTPKYNQGLSVRRAQVVAAQLVKDGVPKNAIAITGFGETNPLVPTGDNVREPQNRRVEIVIK